jgi:hypothetical protein
MLMTTHRRLSERCREFLETHAPTGDKEYCTVFRHRPQFQMTIENACACQAIRDYQLNYRDDTRVQVNS